jgi:hypothetical protein
MMGKGECGEGRFVIKKSTFFTLSKMTAVKAVSLPSPQPIIIRPPQLTC